MLTLSDPGYDVWRRFRDGRGDPGQHPVVLRWRRVSELRAVAPPAALGAARSERSLGERQQRTASHFARGQHLLRAGDDELSNRGCALFLADQDGILLASHALNRLGDPALLEAFPEGARWDELARGTNAIGTALAENGAVAVIGAAHSDPESHRFVCYAAPIHDMDGRIVAVLDATGPVKAADPLIGVAVEGLASAFEGLLRQRALDELAERVKVLEHERAETRDELDDTLRSYETFVATIGHDLRNPLGVVLSGADALRRGDDSQRKRVAERIRTSGQRMLGLIDQLSDLARARLAGGIGLSSHDAIDLAALTERVVDELRVLYPGRAVMLDRAGDCRGYWNAVRIEQVASNLIGNALRHGARDEAIRVQVDGRRGGSVTLAVSNAGVIEPSVLPFIFDPFRSGNPRQSSSVGLGLGLYIVQEIIRAHGGDIDVVTKEGTTTFRVRLPRTL